MRSRPRATSLAHRSVRCLSCRLPMPLADAVKRRGVCALCVEELAILGWRLVYDRERKVGAIPPNLRAAYRL
jgi:hypothetical protein